MPSELFYFVNCCCFSPTTEGDLRLVGGARDNEGRVEVYHRGEWGTVCDDSWSITDAHVVCRQLGYSGATSARTQAFYGRGSGPIYYDDVACTGSETRLADCFHNGIGIENCAHNENAGVVCGNQGELIEPMLVQWLHWQIFKPSAFSYKNVHTGVVSPRMYNNNGIGVRNCSHSEDAGVVCDVGKLRVCVCLVV